jgi:hypothetical protein
MIFPTPLFPATQTPAMKTPRLIIEGKWKLIGKMVKELINDGWTQVNIEANEQFTLTVVELERK